MSTFCEDFNFYLKIIFVLQLIEERLKIPCTDYILDFRSNISFLKMELLATMEILYFPPNSDGYTESSNTS